MRAHGFINRKYINERESQSEFRQINNFPWDGQQKIRAKFELNKKNPFTSRFIMKRSVKLIKIT